MKRVPQFNAPLTVYCTYISQICTQILAVWRHRWSCWRVASFQAGTHDKMWLDCVFGNCSKHTMAFREMLMKMKLKQCLTLSNTVPKVMNNLWIIPTFLTMGFRNTVLYASTIDNETQLFKCSITCMNKAVMYSIYFKIKISACVMWSCHWSKTLDNQTSIWVFAAVFCLHCGENPIYNTQPGCVNTSQNW